MIRSLWTASSGMRAGQLAVDNAAHNVANVNTVGYRRSEVDFADLLYQTSAAGRLETGSGVYPSVVTRDLTPGALEATGGEFDLAIAGGGFFAVLVDEGDLLYTRDGSFHRDAAGSIVNANGYALDIQPPDGTAGPVRIPTDATAINIAEDGTITYLSAGAETPLTAGRVMLWLPQPLVPGRTAEMVPHGQNLYGPAEGTAIVAAGADDEGAGTIKQGYLERSNVSLADEMVGLIVAQRAYQLNARAVQTADTMLALANNIRRG